MMRILLFLGTNVAILVLISFTFRLLGIEGLERLWGDEPTLVRRALAITAPLLPGRPRAGIGNTRFGAAVSARIGAGAVPAGGRLHQFIKS